MREYLFEELGGHGGPVELLVAPEEDILDFAGIIEDEAGVAESGEEELEEGTTDLATEAEDCFAWLLILFLGGFDVWAVAERAFGGFWEVRGSRKGLGVEVPDDVSDQEDGGGCREEVWAIRHG